MFYNFNFRLNLPPAKPVLPSLRNFELSAAPGCVLTLFALTVQKRSCAANLVGYFKFEPMWSLPACKMASP